MWLLPHGHGQHHSKILLYIIHSLLDIGRKLVLTSILNEDPDRSSFGPMLICELNLPVLVKVMGQVVLWNCSH